VPHLLHYPEQPLSTAEQHIIIITITDATSYKCEHE